MNLTAFSVVLIILANAFPSTQLLARAALRIDESPCTVTWDDERGGEYVNCSARGLRTFQPSWFPQTATTLNLDHNVLNVLSGGSFSHLKKLKVLSICYSQVVTLEENALMGLGQLEELNLEHNYIFLSKIPPRVFSHVPKLMKLYLKRNIIGDPTFKEFANTFSDLKNLKTLSLDGNSSLYMGQQFSRLEKLTCICIEVSHVVIVTNESLKGFQNVSLRELVLESPKRGGEVTFETGVFRYLKTLQVLRVRGLSLSNKIILRSLWPFENKAMAEIELQNLSFMETWDQPKKQIEDGLITKDNMKYLTSICLLQLIWNNCQIVGIDISSFDGFINMKRCLRSLQFNRQLVDRFYTQGNMILRLLEFKRLEEFQFSGSGWCGSDVHFKLHNYQNMEGENRANLEHAESGNSGRVFTAANTNDCKKIDKKVKVHKRKSLPSTNVVSGFPLAEKSKGAAEFRIPKTLQKVIAIGSGGGITEVYGCHILDGQNMREVRYVSCSELILHDFVTGLDNVALVDVTGSKVKAVGLKNVFQSFPNLQTLIANSLQTTDVIYHFLDRRWLNATPKLQQIELSDNRLHYLPRLSFSTNLEMAYVVLSKNSFTSLGFDVSNTPALTYLDMSHNAISTLKGGEMTALDEHPQTRAFGLSLSLHGNPLQCVCSRLPFLIWLHTTLVRMDNSGNYTCIDERGYFIRTGDLAAVKAIWRRCVGRTAFLVSICLVLVMAFGFLALYRWWRYKTALRNFFLNLLNPAVRPKTMSDYQYHVFIGYADEDFRFIRHILRRYLEEDLHLRTYIHQRDLGPGYLDQQFQDAIQSSWRLLIVLSANFLRSYDKAHLVMKMCTSSVDIAHPDRILLLVEECQARYVPDYVLATVEEDQLIRVTSLREQLNYEQKQRIKHLILS